MLIIIANADCLNKFFSLKSEAMGWCLGAERLGVVEKLLTGFNQTEASVYQRGNLYVLGT